MHTQKCNITNDKHKIQNLGYLWWARGASQVLYGRKTRQVLLTGNVLVLGLGGRVIEVLYALK